MTAFDGFSTENLVPLPAEFFTAVLPCISSAAELKVTLHLFWAVSRQRGRAKRVDWETLLADESLIQGLRAISALRPAAELLEEGLARAVERRTILHVVSAEAGRAVNWYLVNTAANRAWAERHNGARLEPAPDQAPPAPGIFALYEQNIGLLTPMLVEELREADRKYPAAWLEDAVRAAVEANIRNWRYIRRILERWEADGKESAPHRSEQSFDLSKYTSGKYAAFFGRTDTND
ncbi:MAG TPA: DnaD domain protein [Herpetosiphonaceae bacterium]|nr:DnaD domain protein [Herpetosiphonaceae bacterium]